MIVFQHAVLSQLFRFDNVSHCLVVFGLFGEGAEV